VTGWLVPSAGQKIPVQPGWYLPPQKTPLHKSSFLQAGKEVENTKEKSRQCVAEPEEPLQKRRVALSRSKSQFHTGPKSLTQPLAQAENGDEQFWKERFHAANGKAEACTQRCLVFFPFKFWVGGGGGEDFFHFSFVPDMFP